MNNYGDPIWELIFSSRSWGKYPPEEVIRFIMYVKHYLKRKKLLCLDIGCGIGACTWFIAKEIGRIVAMDGSKSALCNLKKIFREFNISLENIELVHGDITFPENYLNNSFDILVDNYSLYANSAINIRRAYLQYYHLLSRGGLFLANCFGKKTTGFNTGIKIDTNTFRNIEKGVLKDKGITTFWDREELNNMFKKIGYQIVKIENVVENRNSIFIEKHITYLMK